MVNRFEVIKDCIDKETIGVKQGNGEATKRALSKLLLNNWEGPIVKFLDKKEQSKLIKGEKIFEEFVQLHRNWEDPNTQVLAIGGDV